MSPVPICGPSTSDSSFGLAVDGRLRFVYTTFRPTSYDMHLAEFSLDGLRLTPPGELAMATGPLNEFVRGIAQDAGGAVTALVFDEWIPGQLAQSNTWIGLYRGELFADGFEAR